MKSKSFAETVGAFLGISFKAGGTESDGYDCIGLVGRLCQARGLVFPEEFEGWNKDNFDLCFQQDPKKAVETMIRFFDSFATRLDINQIVAGDLIVVEQADSILFPAVYTGSGNAVTSFTKSGVSVFCFDISNKPKFAWRLKWQQQEQQ